MSDPFGPAMSDAHGRACPCATCQAMRDAIAARAWDRAIAAMQAQARATLAEPTCVPPWPNYPRLRWSRRAVREVMRA
jgi:hypothetical protein